MIIILLSMTCLICIIYHIIFFFIVHALGYELWIMVSLIILGDMYFKIISTGLIICRVISKESKDVACYL